MATPAASEYRVGVSEAVVRRATAAPWLIRAYAATGASPARVGATLAIGAIAAFFALELALGRFALAAQPGDPLAIQRDMRLTVIHVLVTAYLASAFVATALATEWTTRQLEPLLRHPAPARDWREERMPLWSAAGLGGLASVLINLFFSPGTVSYDPSTWDPETAWHRILSFPIGMLIFQLWTLVVIDSRHVSRLAADVREVDLLDQSSLAPFARHGLHNALLVTGFAAVFALFMLDDLLYVLLFGSALVVTVAAAAVSLALPLRGLSQRIGAAKARELAWCRARIRRRREALEGEDDGARRDARLDELLAWEARIEAVREWPLDAPALRRFGLYLLIPLGSWSGGALIERAIDALLD